MTQQLIPYKKIHFIAIGGIGMSALARIFLDCGHIVSGSDRQLNNITNSLQDSGAIVYEGHDAKQVEDADLVVFSSAIRPNNVEILEAKRLNIPIWHRLELLAALIAVRESIAVTGTHGKTTTSSMLACILYDAKLDPTAILGGEVAALGGNSRYGQGNHLVAEADESNGLFVKLSPKHAVILNIEPDHLDHYASFAEIEQSFHDFAKKVPANGNIVLGIDCPSCHILAEKLIKEGKQVITCALNGPADYNARDIKPNPNIGGISFLVDKKGNELGRVQLIVPGKHNVQDALCALAMALELGVSFEDCQSALSRFTGSLRRFQKVYSDNGVQIYDEYSHHPTEIRAALRAGRDFETKRLIAVFQPHLYSRTRLLLKDFASSFAEADLIVLTDIYGSREDPQPGIDGTLLYEAIRRVMPDKKLIYQRDKKRLARTLQHLIKPGDLVLMLGAGDINSISQELKSYLN